MNRLREKTWSDAMGNLSVLDPGSCGKDLLSRSQQVIHVEMEHFAVSKKDILMTWGAGPCANIVVNNPNSRQGGLSHVWNTSTDQALLYRKARRVVDLMLEKLGAPASGGEIYVFAGQAFKYGSHLVTRGRMDSDLPDFLQQHYYPRYKIFDYMNSTEQWSKSGDQPHYSGDIAFDTINQTVYRLSADELRQLQSVMTERGASKLPAEL